MTVVIDVGCATHDTEQSIPLLLERFAPSVLYGVDPHPATRYDDPRVIVDQRAAWTRNGRVGYTATDKPTHSYTFPDGRGHDVACFDLAELVLALQDRYGEPVVLKLDCEGAEYPLLEHLIDQDVDTTLSLLLVEWHRQGIDDCDARRANLEDRLRCPVEEWL